MAVAVVAAVVVLVAPTLTDRATVWTVLCVGLAAMAVAAAWCAVAAARASKDRRRWVWVAMTGGLIVWAVGTFVFAMRPPGAMTVPVAGDIAHVAFWLAAFSALVLIPANTWYFSWLRTVLDALVIGTALFIVAWLLLRRFVDVADVGDSRALLVTVVYLSTAVVASTIGVLVVSRARGRHRTILILLATGITVTALARGAFVYVTARQDADAPMVVAIGWGVGILLIGAAAAVAVTVGGDTQASALPPKTSLWLPYLPIVVACAVCTVELFAVPGLPPVLFALLVMVSGMVARQYLVMRDNRRMVAAATEEALRDPLTGVGNRALLLDRLTHALDLRQRDRSDVTVLALDLDHFKLVNVSLGHPAGDTLLAAVSERVVSCLRTGDTVARLRGDEFAVLMEGSAANARAVAHRVLLSFDAPFTLDGHDVMIRPSVGLAILCAEEMDVCAEVLLQRAETAMNAAKTSGSGGLRIHTPDLDLSTSTAGGGAAPAVQLLGELRRAIDRQELAVVYQPQIDLRSGAIAGLEALVRWPHEHRGTIEPDRFLPLVRQYGLMPALTDLVVKTALDDLAVWHRRQCAVPVAVNLFAPSLADVQLPLSVAWALAERKLPAELLTIEITEDLVLEDTRRTSAVLGDLRARGIRIAIDDFGSGYSALSYLRELPVDEMKVCKQLVEPITVDPRADAVVGAVIELAHILGARVVAEGVEDEATHVRLQQLDCDIGQGYHYFRPLDFEATTRLLLSRLNPRFENSVIG
ncbi:putative bifunctional diguanylate cyclase/phosphodiesterase [Mycobacterium sp. MS1601]|uniref:putative bifunctional diguanylate cyclase/phosphodiesterase n=1 Tax=Mycobacterium sp. MS1601 TaxID=1936029 RepID=UPI0009FB518B|nr:bifunctional diguanylate cyclase/phosphodiesterase [Mycobacterium sp. MS1601]